MQRYTFNILMLYIVSFLFSSCSEDQGKDSEYTFNDRYTLEPVDKLDIPLDKETSFRSYYLQCFINNEDNREILAYENRNINGVNFYDIESRKIVHKLSLDKTGPNGVGEIRGFIVKNLDTVYVSSGPRLLLYMVDRGGSVKKKYSLSEQSSSERLMPVSYTFKPILSDSHFENLYFSVYPEGDYNSPRFWDTKLTIKLDLNSGKVEELLDAPVEYQGKVYGAFFSHYSVTKNNEDVFAVGFPFDDELVVTNFSDVNKKVYAGSKFFGEIPSWENPRGGKSESFYLESNSYRELVYDPWRKVYYRFAYKATSLTDASGALNDWNDKRPSIIILDEDFNKKGEVELPESTYYTRDFFVSKKGLYISNNHLKNKGIDEDVLSFTLFKLSEI